ncbi:hypothetical protein TNCV_4586451 [Trichonephila clavipes]|nr:hypothetical protein TNCV_4586451 [Trichonephila clavipes]
MVWGWYWIPPHYSSSTYRQYNDQPFLRFWSLLSSFTIRALQRLHANTAMRNRVRLHPLSDCNAVLVCFFSRSVVYPTRLK